MAPAATTLISSITYREVILTATSMPLEISNISSHVPSSPTTTQSSAPTKSPQKTSPPNPSKSVKSKTSNTPTSSTTPSSLSLLAPFPTPTSTSTSKPLFLSPSARSMRNSPSGSSLSTPLSSPSSCLSFLSSSGNKETSGKKWKDKKSPQFNNKISREINLNQMKNLASPVTANSNKT
jgi:hypothetical protein